MEKKLEIKRLAGVGGEGQGGAILGRIMDKGVKVCRKTRMDLCCCCCSCWRKVQFPLLLHTSTKKPPLVQNSKNLHTNKCTRKTNYVLLLYKSRSFTGLKNVTICTFTSFFGGCEVVNPSQATKELHIYVLDLCQWGRWILTWKHRTDFFRYFFRFWKRCK